jgi:hypothetical protein
MEDFSSHEVGVADLVESFEQKALSGKVRAESLHPFDKEAFIASLKEQLQNFTQNVARGYEVISEAALEIGEKGLQIAGIPAMGKRSMKAIKWLFPTKLALDAACDQKSIEESLDQGVPLFEILGLEPQIIANMYAISFYLLDQKRDGEASYAFRLLTLLAPYMVDFWIGSGLSLLRCNDLAAAREALERALVMDPSSRQALVLLCRVLIQQGCRGEAEARLNAKLDDAARRGDQDLYEALETIRFGLSSFAPAS